ncbi:hypothetical protein APUTEX25_002187, partial [Auxenochlorella protothecoides]
PHTVHLMADLPAYPEEVLPSPAAAAAASGEGAADDMPLLTERKSSVTIPITPLPITLQGSEDIQEHAEEMTEPQPEAEADESAFATAESNGNGEEAEGSAACTSFDAGETEVQEDADCEEDGGELLSQLSHGASGALAGPGRQCVEVAHEGGAEDGATAAAQGGPGPQPSAGGSDGDQRAEAGQEDSGSETYTSDGDDDDGYITTAAAFGHRTFAESLTIHVSEMERARDAALAEAAPRVSARDIGTTLAAQAVGPLDLKVHVSELERARDEALAEAAPRVSARSRVEDGLEREVHQMIPAKATAGRRVVIIGDVHGCLEDLHLLLENVAEPNDLIICTGDITGKGPDVLDTLKTVHEMGILSVRGNHDDRAAGYWHRWSLHGENPSDPEFDWVKDLEPAVGDFLLNLPFTISLEAYNVLVVHGGLLPGVPLACQDLAVMYTIRFVVPARPPPFGSFSWALERRMLAEAVRSGRITVPPAYQLEARERPDWKEGRPWGGQWQGPQHVIFGHASSRMLQLEPFATGIDTGCVGGGYLSACILPALTREGEIVPDTHALPPFLYQQTIRLQDGEGLSARVCMQPSLQPGFHAGKDAKGQLE